MNPAARNAILAANANALRLAKAAGANVTIPPPKMRLEELAEDARPKVAAAATRLAEEKPADASEYETPEETPPPTAANSTAPCG